MGPAGSGAFIEETAGFAGFTPTSYVGGLGGRVSAHALCDAAFTGAHLCHASEYMLTNSASPVPATSAWLDPSVQPNGTLTTLSSPLFGRGSAGTACGNWTLSGSGNVGSLVTVDGVIITGTCNVGRPIACCL
jgi:hypothetical protein